MNQLHLVTVGISLLTNFERASGLPREKALRRTRALDDFLAKDPRAASAEINALAGRLGGLDAIADGLGVSLVYTETLEGRATAGALRRFLKSRGVAVAEIKLPGIEMPAEKRADTDIAARAAVAGLQTLREKAAEHVRKMRRQQPDLPIAFNVTGGYKAEVAVLYGLGRELGIPVYYLHETYRAVLELP